MKYSVSGKYWDNEVICDSIEEAEALRDEWVADDMEEYEEDTTDYYTIRKVE